MTDIAIIGGTGLNSLAGLEVTGREVVYTPYGAPSGPFTRGRMAGRDVIFLARHGYGHTIPPHKVNYRANIWALHSLGVRRVIAVASVGGITSAYGPGCIAIPHQLLDYTWGRACTFFERDLEIVTHVDFTAPYTASLRAAVLTGAAESGVAVIDGGVYAAVQGPRLETAAEIDRLERDGADMVGMTGMPEAVLARELEMEYACLSVVSNHAAGRGSGTIHEQIGVHLRSALADVVKILGQVLSRL